MSWISLLANSRSFSTSQALSTLPRSGRIACVSLSRPILALPPAESPSTRKISLSARSRLSQSVSLPGSTATPEPFFFSTLCAARWRVCAWRITSSASFLPYSTCWLSQSSSAGLTQLDTRRSASRLFSRSLIWPWNCGSSTLDESTKLARENTSSGIGLTPLGRRPCMSMKPLIAPNRPSFSPDSWVPPATVGIRLT